MNTPYRMPSLRSLYAFTYAGRYLSFKEAADALFLTASAVSHQVRNLEDFLGVPLFVRKTRALAFTDAGEKYFNFLDEMFARLETETHQLWAEFGRKIIANMLMIGFINEIAELVSRDSLLRTIEGSVPPGTEELNIAASEMGARLAAAQMGVEK